MKVEYRPRGAPSPNTGGGECWQELVDPERPEFADFVSQPFRLAPTPSIQFVKPPPRAAFSPFFFGCPRVFRRNAWLRGQEVPPGSRSVQTNSRRFTKVLAGACGARHVSLVTRHSSKTKLQYWASLGVHVKLMGRVC